MEQHVAFVENIIKKKLLRTKIIEKLEIIAILQVNREVQHIVFVI